MNKKVKCVFGTCPETVKMAPVIRTLQASKSLTPLVVLTAQQDAVLDQTIANFQIIPDCNKDVITFQGRVAS